jgi:hypothetical protein
VLTHQSSAACPVGCVNTDSEDAGWSARIMWREDAEIESYMYYPYRCACCMPPAWLCATSAFQTLCKAAAAFGAGLFVHSLLLHTAGSPTCACRIVKTSSTPSLHVPGTELLHAALMLLTNRHASLWKYACLFSSCDPHACWHACWQSACIRVWCAAHRCCATPASGMCTLHTAARHIPDLGWFWFGMNLA